MSTPEPTLESQLSSFQEEVRSLFFSLGAEIRTEQIKQEMKLNEAVGKIDMGHIAIHRLQEVVGAIGRNTERLRKRVETQGIKGKEIAAKSAGLS